MTSPGAAELSLLLRILQETPSGIWVAAVPSGELTYANRTFTEIMGMPARDDVRAGEYTPGYDLRTRTGEPYPEEKLPFVRVQRERGAVVVDDIVIHRRDGQRVYVNAVGKPLFDADGAMTHVIVSFRDVTAEVAAEAAHASAQQRLRMAIDHAPIILFAVDRDGIITLSEGAGLRGMGFRPGQLVGQSAHELYRDHPQTIANFRRALSGDTFTTVTDLGSVALESWMAPQRDEAGNVTGMIGVSTDISDRLRLERQMAQADRLSALGRLAASVAHEINNPLAYTIEALRLALELVDKLPPHQGGGAEDVVERLRRVLADGVEGADRVRHITGDLKAFSRPDQDVRRPLDLNRTLAAAIKLVAKRTGTRAQIDLQLGPTVTVRADENRLVQIFVNLILNAADALPAAADHNRIRISTRVDGSAVVIEIADNGPGVPSHLRARIFEPFFTTKSVGEGTGLGLFVTRNLVDTLRGTITIGDAPEGGALFSVRLPMEAAKAPAQTEAAAPATAGPPAVRRPRVLIVDDEPQVALLLRMTLENECDVRMFTSGRAALEHLLGGASYDVIFCDLMMADVSGMKFYDELRQGAPGREGGVVFMTGGVFDPRVSEFLASIPNACVDKPFDIRAEVRRRVPA